LQLGEPGTAGLDAALDALVGGIEARNELPFVERRAIVAVIVGRLGARELGVEHPLQVVVQRRGAG
jgi:hypothetical protein